MKVSTKSEKFLWVGNDPAIDFANTEIVQDGKVVDLLEKSQDLLDWLAASGLISADSFKRGVGAVRNAESEKALLRARDYRAILKSALEAIGEGGNIKKEKVAIAETNRLLAEPRATFTLSAEKAPQMRQDWIIRDADDFIRPIAFAFARLLTTQDVGRIHKCQNPECVLFFLDTSKSSTRAWCSMDICGNKLRVAAFRKRQAGQQ
jgi:predicted RNA-binding Zn ribbon-like protein